MDALQTAQARLTEAEVFYDISERKDGNAHYRSLSERCYREALAFAAVAQAEQLKRIADALEALQSQDEMAESVRIYAAGER